MGNSPSEEEMEHWTPTGIEPTNYGDDEVQRRMTLSTECKYTVFKINRPTPKT